MVQESHLTGCGAAAPKGSFSCPGGDRDHQAREINLKSGKQNLMFLSDAMMPFTLMPKFTVAIGKLEPLQLNLDSRLLTQELSPHIGLGA